MFALALALALIAAPAPSAGEVRISGDEWRALQDALVQPTPPPPQPWVERRELTFTRVDGGLELRGVFRLRALQPGWFLGDLLGPEFELLELRWGSQPAAVSASELGFTVAGYVRGAVDLQLLAFLPHSDDQGPRSLQIMPAVSGKITLPDDHAAPLLELRLADLAPTQLPAARTPTAKRAPAGGLDPADGRSTALPRAGATYFSGASRLELRRAPEPVLDADALVLAAIGIGLTVGDAELRGRARLRYQVRRGHIDRLSVRVRGLSGDLELQGAGVRQWRRSGDQLEVELQAPVHDRLDLEIRWTEPVSKATESNLALPTIEPLGVYRSEAALQLARDGEIELIPALSGWTAVPAALLPAYSRDLVEGTPTAAYTAGEPRPGRLDLLRFIPAPGPPVVVDVADYTVATSHEGRLLVRALYELRNERAAHLRITPPPGLTILGARVGADVALPARDRRDPSAWLLPLQRSVETVKGALSFTVEVIFIGESTPWRRRERRSLQLPTLSAPIAVTRLTLHLPPGYTTRLAPGDGDVVARFDRGEGITYGLRSGDVDLAELDARFQEAVGSWLKNDFDAAQAHLDDLRRRGARSDNIDRLQANLDVVSGKDGKASSGDVAVERRIKEQAKARAAAEVQQQAELEREAEDLRRRGDYERAELQYSRSLVIGEKLAKLEQAESVEQSARNIAIATELEATKKKSKGSPRRQLFTKSTQPAATSTVTLYEFNDDAIEGELPRPDGAVLGPAPPEAKLSAAVVPEPRAPPPADQPVPKNISDDDAPPPEPGASRDFVAVVETTESARSYRRVSLAGAARRPLAGRRARAGGGAEKRPPPRDNDADGVLDGVDLPEEADKAGASPDLDRLPPPKVTASALSVVIPAAGRAILYQHLLLAPDAPYLVEIKAHEPLFSHLRKPR